MKIAIHGKRKKKSSNWFLHKRAFAYQKERAEPREEKTSKQGKGGKTDRKQG